MRQDCDPKMPQNTSGK